MAKIGSVINLSPIDARNKKRKGIIGRLFITKRFKGKKPRIVNDGGHYLFVGRQRTGGKTTSMIWFYEFLKQKYEKKGKSVIVYSNMGFGRLVTKRTLKPLLKSIVWNQDVVHIFCLDEIQSWFPKDVKDMETIKIIEDLVGEFSQLGKRNIFVLSTAQIYGRVNKNLREQCVYMVNCRISPWTRRCINDFINNDDVLVDDLGRWSGDAEFIYIHGLPKMEFNTHYLVSSDG